MTQRTPRQHDPLQASHHWWHRWHVSTQKFAAALVVMTLVLGFSYVWLTNSTAAQGFAIDDLQEKIATLQADNEKLELQAADLRSLSGVEVSTQALNLQPADSFEYLPASGGPVALQP